MKLLLTALLLFPLFLAHTALGQKDTSGHQKTWTYTYIKAKPNQADRLIQFIEKNWFTMDSIAVEKGLFHDYQLLQKNTNADSTSWDFIVAVEYYTKGTYADIQDEWSEIRKNHKKVLIDGYDFNELGQVVKSEEIVKLSSHSP